MHVIVEIGFLFPDTLTATGPPIALRLLFSPACVPWRRCKRSLLLPETEVHSRFLLWLGLVVTAASAAAAAVVPSNDKCPSSSGLELYCSCISLGVLKTWMEMENDLLKELCPLFFCLLFASYTILW